MEIRLQESQIAGKEFIAIGEDEEFLCNCGKQLEEGYACETIKLDEEKKERHKVFCKECQDECDMMLCRQKPGQMEHSHMKFRRVKSKEEDDNS